MSGQAAEAETSTGTAPPLPLEAAEFAALMARLAPFEPSPHLAVALSGGSDSMALTLLADEWARARGGRITALTVDHGLRPEAACEAAQAGAWCRARGIAQVILRREGPVLRTRIQASARAARYRLLEEWCAAEHVLHLLVAHQRDDQAETVLMRLERGSGIVGLAGMAIVSERAALRLLRPVLGVPRDRLRATLAAREQPWIEDPSNRNRAFTRVRLRERIATATDGMSATALAASAQRLGRARAALETAIARLLAQHLMLHPAGFAWLDRALVSAPRELGLGALGAAIVTIGGADYTPRLERLERLYAALSGEDDRGGWTLGGCLLQACRDRLLLCREPSAVAPPLPAQPGQRLIWDRRFALTLAPWAPDGLWIGALGRDAAEIRHAVGQRGAAIPGAVWPSLPVLRDAKGVVAVPGLGYFEERWTGGSTVCPAVFRPNRPLTVAGFTFV